MTTSDLDYLLADKAKVEEILKTIPEGDVVGRMSFESRLKSIEEELKEIC